VAILLGFAASVAYGAADFVGGLVSRRNAVLTVVLVSQLVGLAVFLPFLPILADGPPVAGAWIWGAVAGLAGGAGVAMLYRGLSIGRMSVVAPITSALAAAVPVVVGLARGERPGPASLAGVGIALVAVILVSSSVEPSEPGAPVAQDEEVARRGRRSAGLLEALGAGASFGLFFIALDRAPVDSGGWPLLAMRMGSLSLFLVALAVLRPSLRPARGTGPAIAAAGALDMGANLLYLSATRLGLLSIVAVLASLYPATTVLLARGILRERFGRLQLVGLLAAAAGVVLIALG
jgi:drug/metabolite transporter (DMT)-like permease